MNIRIGGVPEHFNLPWELAMERDLFSHAGVELDWTFYAGGTGAMTKALARGDLDIAILLTEGFISAVHNGLEASIVKVYIDSPMRWGIHTGKQNALTEVSATNPARIAISRFGSGSHLMALIHAEQRKVELNENHFVVVNSLHGAIDSLVKNETDLFYWEPFMTKPFVTSGQVRRIGTFSAPWSSFLVVASKQALRLKAGAIKRTLDIMNAECVRFKKAPESVHQLTQRFQMNAEEARQWLEDTQWNQNYYAELELLVNSRNALTRVNACSKSLRVEHLCHDWITLI